MKLSAVAVGIFLLMVISLQDASAKRKNGKKNPGNNSGCSEWTYGDCAPIRGDCGKGKKQGTRTGDTCELKERKFRCMVPCPEGAEDEAPTCNKKKYSKDARSECDASTNLQTLTFTLKDSANTDCPATLVKSLECRRVAKNKGKKTKPACKFTRGEWSECDETTGQRTRVDTLKKSKKSARDLEGGCKQSRTLTNPCQLKTRTKRKARNEHCSDWTFGDCVPKKGTCGKGRKTGTRTGDMCELKEKEFRCELPCGANDENPSCRKQLYNRGTWSECDAATKQKTMTLTIKDGSNTVCPATQVKTKKCRDVAEGACPARFYDKGPWSDCDPATYLKTGTMTLKAGSNAACPTTKTTVKKCKLLDNSGKKVKPACKFAKGDWSECDDTTGMRTRVDTLMKAKDDNHTCAETRTMKKRCKNP